MECWLFYFQEIFMIKIIKKLFKKPNKEEQKIESFANSMKEKSSKTVNFIVNFFEKQIEELLLMKEKSKNLLETNIKNGLFHLEKGNISDAIFRFKFTTFFWPKSVAAQYYLAYCYVLKNQKNKAREILNKIIKKHPFHLDALKLLKKIDEK